MLNFEINVAHIKNMNMALSMVKMKVWLLGMVMFGQVYNC
jgi:hypothetical protein